MGVLVAHATVTLGGSAESASHICGDDVGAARAHRPNISAGVDGGHGRRVAVVLDRALGSQLIARCVPLLKAHSGRNQTAMGSRSRCRRWPARSRWSRSSIDRCRGHQAPAASPTRISLIPNRCPNCSDRESRAAQVEDRPHRARGGRNPLLLLTLATFIINRRALFLKAHAAVLSPAALTKFCSCLNQPNSPFLELTGITESNLLRCF